MKSIACFLLTVLFFNSIVFFGMSTNTPHRGVDRTKDGTVSRSKVKMSEDELEDDVPDVSSQRDEEGDQE